MISHGEKCSHCGGHLSDPKPVKDGPRKGQTQKICSKCGHIKYIAAAAQPTAQQ
jgi:rRNA maturation protein Nop10